MTRSARRRIHGDLGPPRKPAALLPSVYAGREMMERRVHSNLGPPHIPPGAVRHIFCSPAWREMSGSVGRGYMAIWDRHIFLQPRYDRQSSLLTSLRYDTPTSLLTSVNVGERPRNDQDTGMWDIHATTFLTAYTPATEETINDISFASPSIRRRQMSLSARRRINDDLGPPYLRPDALRHANVVPHQLSPADDRNRAREYTWRSQAADFTPHQR
ncbi:hypothetical protein HYPSUDRAFT_206492 [Hypholoma sublateritium FD-334 SS-4]|uniref:Uncharacterized protein n=1 Tax=Hypholoma sublateritium (strain FD-334 SS-4) TaxID=945553 RepID=A0A0D2NKC1_HYPSF|nr:hypothetical protein HYPSUDRAFT_206492 [Hypholoma sublateritium FD-334 SS-4]